MDATNMMDMTNAVASATNAVVAAAAPTMTMITTDAAKGLVALPYLKTFTSEAFFFTAGVLMILIHAGFLAYEGGASRSKT